MPVAMVRENLAVAPAVLQSDPTQDSERQLISHAKNGSSAAFQELVERYEARIYRLALNITRHREDAEDAIQNAFLQAFRNLPLFRGDSRFYTWLVRIAVNEALMKLRARRFNEFSIDDSIESEDSPVPRELADWGPSPEERYSQEELRKLLALTINKLEPGYRTVFQLRDIEGLSTEETAELLDLSLSAVKTRLRRARMRLREHLDRYFRPEASRVSETLVGSRIGHFHANETITARFRPSTG